MNSLKRDARGLTNLDIFITSSCILATSLTAGSIFCFPIFGPSLTRDLGLSLTQTNTIWSGAVLGEYISAAIWGALADRFGPNLLCVSASLLFGTGYLLMSHADSTAIKMLEAGQDLHNLQSWHSPSGFVAMSAYFVLVGAGVAASYFSAVIASTRLFPSTPGLAISIPLTLFSLSSLFLSWIGTEFFVDPESGELNTPSFLTFLGTLLFIVNIISALLMKIGNPPDPSNISAQPTQENNLPASEETPLLSSRSTGSEAEVSTIPLLPGVPKGPSLKNFLQTPSFWTLSLLLFVAVGGSEMVMSSVGSMTVSLLGSLGGKDQGSTLSEAIRQGVLIAFKSDSSSHLDPGPKLGGEALRIRSAQVSLLAISNTLARLGAGLASDLLSPSRIKTSTSTQDLPSHSRSSQSTSFGHFKLLLTKGKVPDHISLSRMTLILVAMLGLFVSFSYTAFKLESTDQLPIISILTGTGYGLVFALVPSIMATAYGIAHFGRNWGLASYACAAGSLSYSLLYATVSDYVASNDVDPNLKDADDKAGICYGAQCFRPSFIFASLSLLVALGPVIQLWRKWRQFL